MIDHLPAWIEVLFILITLVTIGLFYLANGKPRAVVLLLLLWSVIHSLGAAFGFYQVTDTIPPRFGLILIPAIVISIIGLSSRSMSWISERRNSTISTLLHMVRLPVEIVLFSLFVHDMVPQLMTFEGRNFDIIIGISAPIVAWLLWRHKLSERALLVWNTVGLVLVLFIFINGMLSAELPFQCFAFDQPNRAILYFPFILLPATIVPIVIWTHLSDMILLVRSIRSMAQLPS